MTSSHVPLKWALGLCVGFGAACFNADPVGVRRIDAVRVTPTPVSMIIGQNISMRAAVLDEFGIAFAGVPVRWSSEDEATVVVTQAGMVTALGRGVAKIIVVADDVSGSADVEVTGPPMIFLTPSTVSFSASANRPNPTAQAVSVSNSGEGSLGTLTLGPVSYGGGQPTDWLTSELSSQPVVITLRVTIAGLPPGSYSADLSVEGGNASNTPVVLPVSLQITP